MELNTVPVEEALSDLLKVFEQRKIKLGKQQVPKKIMMRENFIQNFSIQVQQTHELLERGYKTIFIQQQLGIPAKILQAVRQYKKQNITPRLNRQGNKKNITQQDLSKVKYVMMGEVTETMSSDEIREKILGRYVKVQGKLNRKNFVDILKRDLCLSYKKHTLIQEKINYQLIIDELVDYSQHICPLLNQGINLIFINKTFEIRLQELDSLRQSKQISKQKKGKGKKYIIIGAIDETGQVIFIRHYVVNIFIGHQFIKIFIRWHQILRCQLMTFKDCAQQIVLGSIKK